MSPTLLIVDDEAAQRQLLRMGPDNVALIKAKLYDLKAGLQINS